jgi:hypothetical protein
MTRAIVAQFHKSKGGRFDLWSVTTIEEEADGSGDTWIKRETYDVDWSRKYGYLYHNSGSGGSRSVTVDCIYFASGEVEIDEQPCMLCERSKITGRWKTREIRAINKTRRLPALPKAFRLEDGGDLMEWLEVNGINQDAVWCSECRDLVPGDELCRHCWWCTKTGWYSTPSERCGCKNTQECEG